MKQNLVNVQNITLEIEDRYNKIVEALNLEKKLLLNSLDNIQKEK
jgi:hypothetical protein